MKIATIIQGRVIDHFEGTENDLSPNPVFDQKSNVEMPDWAWEHREANIRAGVGKLVLIYNYDLKEFSTIKPFTETEVVGLLKNDLRNFRSQILTATDWAVTVSDWSLDADTRNQLIEFRQQLRDITKNPMLDDPSLVMNKVDNEENVFAQLIPPIPDFLDRLLRNSAYERILHDWNIFLKGPNVQSN